MLPAALQNRNIYKEFYKKLNKKELKNLQKRRKKTFFPLKNFFPQVLLCLQKWKPFQTFFWQKYTLYYHPLAIPWKVLF